MLPQPDDTDTLRALDDTVAQEPGEARIWETLLVKAASSEATSDGLARWDGKDADRLLRKAGLYADDYSRERFTGRMHQVEKEWAELQHRHSRRDLMADPLAESFPAWPPALCRHRP